jgi:hypothetical protein
VFGESANGPMEQVAKSVSSGSHVVPISRAESRRAMMRISVTGTRR